ncbi:aminoglycoside phosphotransferase family protein [Arcanobacterium haemolyticum]|uniref:Aminoglycoside phosphotransferase n=1 Tax=Arcanobacterium haemolyticum (strain ATCC 9345 / DSM 20595 / CCM 5947 / CCUG 17215 / LMG 16163 / NBRC 15585 / NCTC 8452 / 11018) TaxID=644284 RepID=D7BKC9_ARCHD|nr:aminoglycoside phosphotransferase family protein [Arcanobacterium haemolyticum]ADH93109.1 aminoglycoside phosphotransferase [Arcanobacterium haemolyticum DSM 20595]QCX47169.1 aminoglycoside phosphotransferase family protein [Arcanobacterium haemolyticum]SQH28133.1 Aminoglycoside phosphotransferase [Arcanobacterium haemolyticum]
MTFPVSQTALRRERADHERTILALLTGSDAAHMLSVALAHRGVVRSWNVHAIHHRPGAGVSVGYSVVLDAARGSGGAVARRETYVVASSGRIDEDRLAEVDGRTVTWRDVRVHVWEHPFDPQLPALELACDPVLLGEWLGFDVDVELVAYRPTRRAVVKIFDDSGAVRFGKVMLPEHVDGVATRLRMLERAGTPAPRIERRDDRGCVVTNALDGIPLSKVYASVVPGNLEQARGVLDSLAGVLDSLPLVAIGLPARPAWVERCEHYAEAAASVLPEEADRARGLAGRIRAALERADLGPIVPTHGDFYEANVFVDPGTGRVSGVLDVDSLGPGHRVHDWACLLGHMSVLPGLAPKTYEHVDLLLADWTGCVARWVDPMALGASAAGVVLSLVAGARRSRKKNWQAEALFRLEVAEKWLR